MSFCYIDRGKLWTLIGEKLYSWNGAPDSKSADNVKQEIIAELYRTEGPDIIGPGSPGNYSVLITGNRKVVHLTIEDIFFGGHRNNIVVIGDHNKVYLPKGIEFEYSAVIGYGNLIYRNGEI